MTRKKKRFLWHSFKIAAVIGAAVYSVAGIGSLLMDDAAGAENKSDTGLEITDPTPEVVFSSQITEAMVETKYQSIICSYDWDADESYLLCKIAMAEAGNQDTEGKALVMLVVLNRVWGDNEFPNTIEEVIYQPKQFSPVLEGKFESVEPDEDCWKALDLVESGWDESQGALYFESRSDSTWHEDNLKFLFKHQDHYFYTERD